MKLLLIVNLAFWIVAGIRVLMQPYILPAQYALLFGSYILLGIASLILIPKKERKTKCK